MNHIHFSVHLNPGIIISRFVIEGANSACMVMDITDPANCKIIETELTGSTMSFTIPESNSLREFVLIRTDRTDFPVPVSKGAVECRNLHGWSNKDMILSLRLLYEKKRRD